MRDAALTFWRTCPAFMAHLGDLRATGHRVAKRIPACRCRIPTGAARLCRICKHGLLGAAAAMITPSQKPPASHLTKSEWIVFGVILVYSFIPVIGGLIRVLELAGGPQIAPENSRAMLAPLPITLHILSSALFCVVGAVQFLPSIRRQRPAAHRVTGRVIAVAGCMSALTGLWMTHFYVFPAALQGVAL